MIKTLSVLSSCFILAIAAERSALLPACCHLAYRSTQCVFSALRAHRCWRSARSISALNCQHRLGYTRPLGRRAPLFRRG